MEVISVEEVSREEQREDDVAQASRVLTRAMGGDPSYSSVFGQQVTARSRGSSILFTLGVAMQRSKLLARVDGRIVGYAGWVASDAVGPGLLAMIASLRRSLVGLGLLPTWRVLQQGSALQAERKRQFGSSWRKKHWVLGPVAVDPDYQGQGIGTLLVSEALRRVDAAGGTAAVETDKEENVHFYRRFGFELVGDAEVLGVRYWFLKRAPVGVATRHG